MSSDTTYLLINGKKIDRFISYSVDSDIFTADDAFSVELASPEIEINPPMECSLYVNDRLELSGLIEKVEETGDKNGPKIKATGRDLMGLIIDSYCEEFGSFKDKNLKALATRLLSRIPLIQRDDVVYQENIVGKLKGKSSQCGLFDIVSKDLHIEPGKTIFEVLGEYAKSRGLIFYALPERKFVFGKPREVGEAKFRIINRNDGNGNNALAWSRMRDFSKRYSKVTIISQKQGQDDILNPADINIEATKTDPDVPAWYYKPFVQVDEYGGYQPAVQARLALEKMRHDGFRLQYTVVGHSQQNKNWTVNELCSVRDDRLGLDDVYLIYGRTFEMSKVNGTTTTLRLGYKGMIS